MTNVKIPKLFGIKLQSNQGLEGIVKTTLSTFGDILQDNKLYFFGEYTDHGIKHIESILDSSANLITGKTYNDILKPADVAYYILSVLLHDIGMHINLGGFERIIEGDFDDIRIKELDTHTWKVLWTDFLNEAKKFSGKQLKLVFGDENVIIRIPPLSKPREINEDDKKLIGEFIRRNHARLAHEIAIKGFPGKSNTIEFANGLGLEIKNLIGLIARSHGTNLRKCLNYVELIYGKAIRRIPNSIHAIYLMVLLRLADYIQIDDSRTSRTLLKLKTFSSSISEIEHQTHLAIDDVDDKYQDDPERIFVRASPKDSMMFLKIKKLIKSIQHEFDISWAVLGELYGNINDRPEIKYRRITSNLEDEIFISHQEYIADSFSFKANDEIVKLLIAPLYGNNPSYGVRELLQNAIDACQEKEKIARDQNLYKPIINIAIVNENDEIFFTIADSGIGMDIEVIKNYFLSAGASFRKSMEWQKEFVDENGNTIVRRSGRFGIGILAAFLIGKSIYVETKRINDNIGYKFNADLNTDQINILKDENILEGTFIRIKIEKSDIQKFYPEENDSIKWYEWYTLSDPQILIKLFDKKLESESDYNPSFNFELPIEWNAIDSPGFNKILWTYSGKFNKSNFTCNGIKIPQDTYRLENILDLKLIAKIPKISIFDYNAFLPLSLNRNAFSSQLPFAKELVTDIYKDFIAYFLSLKDVAFANKENVVFKSCQLDYPGLDRSYVPDLFSYGTSTYKDNYSLSRLLNSILICKNGFIINYNYFIQKLKMINVVFIQSEESELIGNEIPLDIENRFVHFSTGKLNSISDYNAAIDSQEFDVDLKEFKPYNSRIYMKIQKYDYLFNSTKKRLSNWLKNKCIVEFRKDEWICLKIDRPKKTIITKKLLAIFSDRINFIREYESYCPHEGDKILNELLEKYIGDDVVIPYSIGERRKKYPVAFKELSRYMVKYSNTVHESLKTSQ